MELEKIPCFLCGNSIEVKNTVKGKPYFICDPCGLQAFIRRPKGMERLREWMEGKGEVFKKKSGGLVLELIAGLEEVKAKLKGVEDKKGFFPDEETKFIETSLKAEMEQIKEQIKKAIKQRNKE
jgi:hypothetical protein